MNNKSVTGPSLDREFQIIHKRAADKYSWKWIDANEEAIKALIDLGVNYTAQPYKTIVSAVVEAVLNTVTAETEKGKP